MKRFTAILGMLIILVINTSYSEENISELLKQYNVDKNYVVKGPFHFKIQGKKIIFNISTKKVSISLEKIEFLKKISSDKFRGYIIKEKRKTKVLILPIGEDSHENKNY